MKLLEIRDFCLGLGAPRRAWRAAGLDSSHEAGLGASPPAVVCARVGGVVDMGLAAATAETVAVTVNPVLWRVILIAGKGRRASCVSVCCKRDDCVGNDIAKDVSMRCHQSSRELEQDRIPHIGQVRFECDALRAMPFDRGSTTTHASS